MKVIELLHSRIIIICVEVPEVESYGVSGPGLGERERGLQLLPRHVQQAVLHVQVTYVLGWVAGLKTLRYVFAS